MMLRVTDPRIRRTLAAPRRAPGAALLVLAAVLLALLGGCSDDDDFTSEGTASSPLALTLPVVARLSEAGPAPASSYYRVSGLSTTTKYAITITGSGSGSGGSTGSLRGDADLFVWQDSNFTSLYCVSVNSGTSNETCTPASISTGPAELFIQVKSFSENGTDFLLTVASSGTTSS